MSGSGALKFRMANGQVCDGVGTTAEGDVYIMTSDNVYRQVHPLIVEAFAKNLVPTGIWLAAYVTKTSKSDMLKGTGILLDPTH